MLRIRLQGELHVELDGLPLHGMASGRARALLAWLALHPGRHARTRVASVFWPDVLESSSRASLRTTLATLRRELREAGDYLFADRERVGLEGPDLWVDVREIDRLAGSGRHADALALCEDVPLLADLDDDWVLEAREDHRELVGRLLVALGDEAEAASDGEAAVAYARRRLELDPLSEDAARALMRRLAAAGDQAAAVAAYEAFARALRRGLGMAPSAETRELAESLRRDVPRDILDLPLPPAFARGSHAPLVGRAESLEGLLAVWSRTMEGPARMVVVEGEAGSGKTRLLAEFAKEVRGGGATALAGRCRESAAGAFAPFAEALRPYVTRAGEDLPSWAVRELARLLPELERDADTPEGAPQDARQRLFQAVAAALARAVGRGPLLLIVEDLHWADAATVGMLGNAVSTLEAAPVLVAASVREPDGTGNPALNYLLADLRADGRLERLTLTGLSEEDTGALAGAWLGRPAPPALAEALRRRTGGNPLFVEELVRHLVESRPERTDDELVAAAGADVPEGVRSVIERRLARLSEPAGRAVRMAAVAGEDFAFADLVAACDIGDEPLVDALHEATTAGLVDEEARPGQFRFAHALIREAVLAGLGGTRRALLHRRLAEELAQQHGDRRLTELALHLLGARPLVDPADAARTALRSAQQSIQALAYEDAVEVLNLALDAELPAPLLVELRLALADAHQRLGDAPAGKRFLELAVEGARTLADGELLARAALLSAGLTVNVGSVRDDVRALLEEALDAVGEESPERPRLLARLAIELYYAQPAALRERLSAEALTIGRRTGGRALLEALGARHVALWSPAHTEERLAIADELIQAARDAGDREGELQGVNWRVVDLFELGELEAMRRSVDDHERLADELRLPGYAWYVPMWRAALALLEHRLDEARRLSEEGARIGRAAHDENADLLFDVQRRGIDRASGRFPRADVREMERRAERSPAAAGWRTAILARRLMHDGPEGVAGELERVMADLTAAPLDANWLYTGCGLGLIAAELGHERVAAELYALLEPFAHRIITIGRGCVSSGSAALTVGLLASTVGDRPAAVAQLEEAVRRNDALVAVAHATAARRELAALVDDERAAALRSEVDAAGVVVPEGVLWTV